MKSKTKKLLIGLIFGFFVLLLLRLTYLLIYEPFEQSQSPDVSFSEISSSNYKSQTFGKIRNIATNTIQQVGDSASEAGRVVNTIVQKYEKIGYIDATSTSFARDEKALRSVIQKYNCLKQYEQNTGLTGSRVLKIAIGVEPDRFNAVVNEMKKIGKLTSFDVSTYDKTTEYRELQAQKASLETSRRALEALKEKGGNINEYINLENRIMELDSELQTLGVNIGDYDKSGNFCTIKFTISESKEKVRIPFMTQTMHALEWTIMYYLLFLFILILASLAAMLAFKTYEAVKTSLKRGENTTLEE